MTVLAAGQHIADRYQLDRRIAVGGMGEVWEASDTRLGRSVAVKVLRPELTDDPEFLHRFRIEARTVASLDHSGIAGVHDYGEDEGAERAAHGLAGDGAGARRAAVHAHRARADLRPTRPCASSRRPPGRCRPPTSAASCTATSSRATSSSAPTAW